MELPATQGIFEKCVLLSFLFFKLAVVWPSLFNLRSKATVKMDWKCFEMEWVSWLAFYRTLKLIDITDNTVSVHSDHSKVSI